MCKNKTKLVSRPISFEKVRHIVLKPVLGLQKDEILCPVILCFRVVIVGLGDEGLELPDSFQDL